MFPKKAVSFYTETFACYFQMFKYFSIGNKEKTLMIAL